MDGGTVVGAAVVGVAIVVEEVVAGTAVLVGGDVVDVADASGTHLPLRSTQLPTPHSASQRSRTAVSASEPEAHAGIRRRRHVTHRADRKGLAGVRRPRPSMSEEATARSI